MTRLLLANDQAVFSISDLWVAQATLPNDGQFSEANLSETNFDDDDVESRLGVDETGDEPDFFGFGTAPPSMEDLRGQASRQDAIGGAYLASPSLTIPRTKTMDSSRRSQQGARARVTSYGGGSRYHRDFSSPGLGGTGSIPSGPALFHHTGLDPMSLASAGALMSPTRPKTDLMPESSDLLNVIPERPGSIIDRDLEGMSERGEQGEVVNKSLRELLPLRMIGQYALLAFSGAVCDQLFMCVLFLLIFVALADLRLPSPGHSLSHLSLLED